MPAYAQGNPYDGQIRVAFPDYEKNGDEVTFRAEVDFTTLSLHTQQMVLLTPVLRSTTSRDELRFAPIAIQGGQRARIIDRAERLGGYDWK